MLTAELRANIDKRWEACWPINMLRPLVLLDLISYLLFIKKIEEKQLIAAWQIETSGNNLTHTNEKDELSWRNFKEMDTQRMHQLFTKERGLYDLIKNYGNANLQYSLFVKGPLLLTPTANLLANMVDIVKIMEAEDSDIKTAIFEYLLHKAEIVGQNGKVYAPDYAVKLVVALMRPAPDDVIGDPSAGNASFLVNSAMYIAGKNSAAILNDKNNPATGSYKGIESDLIQLRIGAMNMISHGIEDPKLASLNIVSKTNLSLRLQPTLILSNLFFEGTEDKMTVEANTSQAKGSRPEISFLNLILKNLRSGGRAAVIIREIILYDNVTDIEATRKHLIDDHKLEAVISLPGKTGSLFSGACILILTKPKTNTTDKVWFYKMSAEKQEHIQNTDSIYTAKNDVLSFAGNYNDIPDILSRWEMGKDKPIEEPGKSFYVPVEEIRTNNYNLNFNEYRKNVKKPELSANYKAAVSGKENIPGIATKRDIGSFIEKKESIVQTTPVKRKLLVISISLAVCCIAAFAFYFLYFNDKNDHVYSPRRYTISPNTNKTEDTTHKLIAVNLPSAQKPAKQFKEVIKDTTANTPVQEKSRVRSDDIKDSGRIAVKSNNSSTLSPKKPARIPEPGPPKNAAKEQFIVTSKAYFHSLPDESTRSRSYINHWSNAVLVPIDDRNGFIYIVYTDPLGQTTKGWLNKSDLRQLQ